MNANELSWLVAIMVAAIGIAIGGLTAWRYRDVPLTREAALRKEIETLRKQLEDADAQINMLLEDRSNDRRYISKLERRVADLERETAYLQRRPSTAPKERLSARAASAAPVESKRLTGPQLLNLRTQLLDAYTTHEQWHALVQDVDHQMDIVAMGDNLRSVVARILNTANAEGWIKELIAEAARQRPNLPALQALAKSLIEALG